MVARAKENIFFLSTSLSVCTHCRRLTRELNPTERVSREEGHAAVSNECVENNDTAR